MVFCCVRHFSKYHTWARLERFYALDTFFPRTILLPRQNNFSFCVEFSIIIINWHALVILATITLPHIVEYQGQKQKKTPFPTTYCHCNYPSTPRPTPPIACLLQVFPTSHPTQYPQGRQDYSPGCVPSPAVPTPPVPQFLDLPTQTEQAVVTVGRHRQGVGVVIGGVGRSYLQPVYYLSSSVPPQFPTSSLLVGDFGWKQTLPWCGVNGKRTEHGWATVEERAGWFVVAHPTCLADTLPQILVTCNYRFWCSH